MVVIKISTLTVVVKAKADATPCKQIPDNIQEIPAWIPVWIYSWSIFLMTQWDVWCYVSVYCLQISEDIKKHNPNRQK